MRSSFFYVGSRLAHLVTADCDLARDLLNNVNYKDSLTYVPSGSMDLGYRLRSTIISLLLAAAKINIIGRMSREQLSFVALFCGLERGGYANTYPLGVGGMILGDLLHPPARLPTLSWQILAIRVGLELVPSPRRGKQAVPRRNRK